MTEVFNLNGYDHYLIMFSGGKDSTACFLHLLELDIPLKKIELWHHLIDGRGHHLMDWECTEDYCRKFAGAFHVPIYYSWKESGFEGEMLRNNSPTKRTWFETTEGLLNSGGNGKSNSRLQFPQLTANLSQRWCSSYLKIDVGTSSIVNQSRFDGKKVLVISGERAEESPSRKHYNFFESDRADNRYGKKKRHVDRCRLIHHWNEKQVWDIIARNKIIVHPCYYLGYSRCSCKWCIFASPSQMATSFALSPFQGIKLIDYEIQFVKTIHAGIDLKKYSSKGAVYEEIFQYPSIANQSITTEYRLPIFCNEWLLPAGAYKSLYKL